MRYGRSLPPGFLPVYSVESEEEARALLTLACQTNLDGEYIARELAHSQTLHNLEKFSDRLAEAHAFLKRSRK